MFEGNWIGVSGQKPILLQTLLRDWLTNKKNEEILMRKIYACRNFCIDWTKAWLQCNILHRSVFLNILPFNHFFVSQQIIIFFWSPTTVVFEILLWILICNRRCTSLVIKKHYNIAYFQLYLLYTLNFKYAFTYAVFLVSLGTSLFPVMHEVQGKSNLKFVPS